MKLLLFAHLCVLFIYGCGLVQSSDNVRRFIPGMYIRFSSHEFGTEYDTLVISLESESAASYRIVRKWKYERVLDGVVIEPEYKRTITSAVYNTDRKLLEETKSGDVYSFDVVNKILFDGAVKYQKL